MADPASPLPVADAICEGGNLDCGSGLLLIIREALGKVPAGGILEVRSSETSVKEDLPAWCNLVGNEFLGVLPGESGNTRYLLRRGRTDEALEVDIEKARSFAWNVRVRSTGGLEARAYVRNHSFTIGQPASFEMSDPAPSAIEILLASLGGCLAVGFRWRASRRGITISDLEVSLRASSDDILVFLGLHDEGSPGLRSVEGTCYVDAEADLDVIEDLWAETVRRSPVARSLLGKVPIEIKARKP